MKNKNLITLICRAVSLAMGIGVIVLNILGELKLEEALSMLGIGLICVSLPYFINRKK